MGQQSLKFYKWLSRPFDFFHDFAGWNHCKAHPNTHIVTTESTKRISKTSQPSGSNSGKINQMNDKAKHAYRATENCVTVVGRIHLLPVEGGLLHKCK